MPILLRALPFGSWFTLVGGDGTLYRLLSNMKDGNVLTCLRHEFIVVGLSADQLVNPVLELSCNNIEVWLQHHNQPLPFEVV